MTEHAYGLATQHTETGNDGGIVSEFSIPVDFGKIRAQVFDVIQKIRTVRMTRELYLLVRREVIHI